MAEKKPKLVFSETNKDEKFSPDYFKGRFEYGMRLGQINLDTPDGLADYLSLYPLGARTDSTDAEQKLQLIRGEESGNFGKFVRANVGGLVGLLGNRQAGSLALDAHPMKKKDGDKNYVVVSDAIRTMQETATAMESREGKEKYLADVLKASKVKEDNPLYALVLRHANIVLDADVRISQERAERALQGFGEVKYIAELAKIYEALGKPTEDETKAMQKLGELERAVSDAVTPETKTAAMAKFDEARKKYFEKYRVSNEARQAMGELMKKLPSMAYSSILEAEKKKAEEASESKNK